jgi:hypothetical protein
MCNVACEAKDERKIPTIDETLGKYGISTKGSWTAIQKAYLLAGILAVAKKLVKRGDKDQADVFKSVYGVTSSDPLVFVMGSCDSRGEGNNQYGGCSDENGDKTGACASKGCQAEGTSGRIVRGQPNQTT